jgi:division protein CdvB (Snf7/Vps24/ESCRT-III family)
VEIIVGMLSSLKLVGGKSDGEYKGKIASALKEIEVERRELEGLRGRLSERRQKLYASAMRALQEKNKGKADVYANEHAEVRKTLKVVEASELALTQVSLRLQSIMEVGDVMAHMTNAFKSLKTISKTVDGLMPALDATSESINSTLAQTMSQMGQLSPGIQVDIKNENADELVEMAKKFAEEQSERLKQSFDLMPSRYEAEIEEVEGRIPVLATGDDLEEESPILGTLFSSRVDPKVEKEVLTYANAHDGVVDVSETSSNLGIPQDEVELSAIRLVAEGKVKPRSESLR